MGNRAWDAGRTGDGVSSGRVRGWERAVQWRVRGQRCIRRRGRTRQVGFLLLFFIIDERSTLTTTVLEVLTEELVRLVPLPTQKRVVASVRWKRVSRPVHQLVRRASDT